MSPLRRFHELLSGLHASPGGWLLRNLPFSSSDHAGRNLGVAAECAPHLAGADLRSGGVAILGPAMVLGRRHACICNILPYIV